MTDDYTIRVLADVLADRTAQLDACIQSATESRDQFQEQLDTAHRLYRDFRRAVQEALGIDRAELLPEDEVVRQVRAAAGGEQEPGPLTRAYIASGYSVPAEQPVEARARVIPMGDPWIAPEQPVVTDDGAPTESLPAVEDPPTVPDGCTVGRVLTRDFDWDLSDLMPLAMVNRAGDWFEFSHIPDGAPSGDHAVYNCAGLESTNSFAELLHMHGMLWEVLDASEQQSGVAGQETAVDHGC